MRNFPIFLIDNHYKLKLSQILIIIGCLSKNRNGTLILTEKKISYLFFLFKNHNLINKVLEAEKKPFPYNEEQNLIVNYRFDIKDILERKEPKNLIKMLIIYDLIQCDYIKNQLYYKLSLNGKTFFKNMKSNYFKSSIKKVEHLKPLASFGESKLFNSIVKRIG